MRFLLLGRDKRRNLWMFWTREEVKGSSANYDLLWSDMAEHPINIRTALLIDSPKWANMLKRNVTTLHVILWKGSFSSSYDIAYLCLYPTHVMRCSRSSMMLGVHPMFWHNVLWRLLRMASSGSEYVKSLDRNVHRLCFKLELQLKPLTWLKMDHIQSQYMSLKLFDLCDETLVPTLHC